MTKESKTDRYLTEQKQIVIFNTSDKNLLSKLYKALTADSKNPTDKSGEKIRLCVYFSEDRGQYTH